MKFNRKMVLIPYEKYQHMLAKSPNDVDKEVMPDSSEHLNHKDSVSTNQPREIASEHVLSDIDLLIDIPKRFHKRLNTLIQFIKERCNISWNNNREITINGRRIINSNISNLLKDTIKHYNTLNTTGDVEFYNILKDANVPLNLISNSKRKAQVGYGIPPPPGQPNRRVKKKTINSLKQKWIKL